MHGESPIMVMYEGGMILFCNTWVGSVQHEVCNELIDYDGLALPLYSLV